MFIVVTLFHACVVGIRVVVSAPNLIRMVATDRDPTINTQHSNTQSLTLKQLDNLKPWAMVVVKLTEKLCTISAATCQVRYF